MSFNILHGDVLDHLRLMPDASFDGCLCDPPYGLSSTDKRSPQRKPGVEPNKRGFMGLEWDGYVPGAEVWSEVLRVLKPGAFLLAFGGARTHHRLMCAIEDAGFEIRDVIMYLFGSGFPKSLNFESRGTALKPAYEPIIMAMRPCDGTFAQNLAKWGVGGLDIDGARVPCEPGTNLDGGRISTTTEGWDRPWKHDDDARARARARGTDSVAKAEALGRWPANIIHDGSDEALDAFPDAPGQLADASTNADQRKTQNVYGAMKRGSHEVSAAKRYTENGSTNFAALPGARRLDSGSAARFFKAVKHDSTCVLCLCTMDSWQSQSESSHTPAKPAETRLKILLETTASTVLSRALIEHSSKIAHNVKSAERLCDSCATGIALSLVATLHALGPALPLFLEFISGQRKLILKNNLASFAALLPSTDTIPTTQSLKILIGSVLHAIAAYTSPENHAQSGASDLTRFRYVSKASRDEREGNPHPTVKPVDLCRYLAKLILPPLRETPRRMLVPYAGSGSEMLGAIIAGWEDVTGIERETQYVAIAERRLSAHLPLLA